jgi:uncharacterized membrane protein (UPF0127 family)
VTERAGSSGPPALSGNRRAAIRGVILACLTVAFYAGAVGGTDVTTELMVVRRDGVIVYLNAEIASDHASRESGLMGREFLQKRGGMLFDFSAPQRVRMWMKNTVIPLDMLFLSETGHIIHIVPHATPMSLNLLGPREPARYVLEINGNEADELAFTPGDRVLIPYRR